MLLFCFFCLKPSSWYWSSAMWGALASQVGLALCLCHDNKTQTDFLPWQLQFCSFSWNKSVIYVFFHTRTQSWKAFAVCISCGGVGYQVMQWGRKVEMFTELCLVPRRDEALGWMHHQLPGHIPSTAITRKGFSQVALSGRHNRESGQSCPGPYWPFFCEPSTTSKAISGFFLWVYLLRAFLHLCKFKQKCDSGITLDLVLVACGVSLLVLFCFVWASFSF